MGVVVLSIGVHAIALAIVGAGAALILTTWSSVTGPIVGAVILALGLALLPRAARLPDGTTALHRSSSPDLHQLVDDIAAVSATRPPSVIRIDADFNASAARYGFIRRRTLTLGAPLIAAANDRELVAVISHELRHFVRRDTALARLTGRSRESLERWRLFFFDARHGRAGGIEGFLLWILGSIGGAVVGLTARLFDHLDRRQRWRAEMLADREATESAGTDAMISALHLSLAAPLLARAQSSAEDGPDRFDEWRRYFRSIPEHERERQKRDDAAQPVDTLASHPRITDRVANLRHAPHRDGITYSFDRQAIDDEASTAASEIGHRRPPTMPP